MDKADKELEGQDLARDQQFEAARTEAHEQEELPEAVTETVRDTAFDHRSRLFDALRLILAGEQVNVTLFYLPQREAHALEALQAAVTGADSMGEFVFAEDRRALLEQSLAVLQQNLTYGEPSQLAELQSKFDDMTAQVGELRGRLVNLEDAQEDIEEWHIARQHGIDPETADKPADDKPADEGLVAFVSTLSDGPEVTHEPKKSSLYDEDEPQIAAPSAMHDLSPQRRVARTPDPDTPASRQASQSPGGMKPGDKK